MEKLPAYSDDEVRVFHPVFERAMKNVLSSLGLNNELELIHHWTEPGFDGIVDFVLRNKVTKKIFLPIELKKTPQVLRAIGRRQARGYLQALGPRRGSDFYLASNLEIVELFKDVPDRKLTNAQLVDLKQGYVGSFKTEKPSSFLGNLEKALIEVLEQISANDGTRFASNVSGLINALETSMQDLPSWHQAQLLYLSDYERGHATANPRKSSSLEWPNPLEKPAWQQQVWTNLEKLRIHVTPNHVCAGKFNTPEQKQILAGAFESGRDGDNFDNLQELVEELTWANSNVLSPVTTSSSLSSVLALHTLRATINSEQLVAVDVGAGTGNLLHALLNLDVSERLRDCTFIEESELYREVLIARSLGKQNSENIGHANHHVRIESFINTPDSVFDAANTIVCNPPFLSGIASSVLKREFQESFLKSTGSNLKLATGQIGIEGVFLEGITQRARPGTLITFVFPSNSLFRPDSSKIREYLMNDFGLKTIVSYPRRGTFAHGIKDTFILIGEKGHQSPTVEFVNYKTSLNDLNILAGTTLAELVANGDAEIEQFERERFNLTLAAGWKWLRLKGLHQAELGNVKLDGEIQFVPLKDSEMTKWIKRGTLGNSGGSDIIFEPLPLDAVLESIPTKWAHLPKTALYPALRNSKNMPLVLTKAVGDTAVSLFESEFDSALTLEGLCNYVNSPQGKNKSDQGAQQKKAKSPADLLRIIQNNELSQGSLVIIPRATRETASIGLSGAESILISTNFVVVCTQEVWQATFLSAWLNSVFGQLEIERLSINQEGMRKSEVSTIEKLKIPSIPSLDLTTVQKLSSALARHRFQKFAAIKITHLDALISRIVFESQAQVALRTALRDLRIAVSERRNKI